MIVSSNDKEKMEEMWLQIPMPFKLWWDKNKPKI